MKLLLIALVLLIPIGCFKMSCTRFDEGIKITDEYKKAETARLLSWNTVRLCFDSTLVDKENELKKKKIESSKSCLLWTSLGLFIFALLLAPAGKFVATFPGFIALVLLIMAFSQ